MWFWFTTAERKVKVSVFKLLPQDVTHHVSCVLSQDNHWPTVKFCDFSPPQARSFSKIQYILENTNTQKHSHWFFFYFFFFKGKCYFSRHSPLLLSFNLAKTLPFKLLQLRGNKTNKEKKTKTKIKTSTEGFIRPEQNTVSVVQGNNHPPLVPRVNNQHKSMDSQ